MPNWKHATVLLIMATLAATPQAAQGGEAYFYSQVTYDPDWGTVYGYAETYYDYTTAYYYYGCTVSYLVYDSTTVDWGQCCAEEASTEVWTYSPTAIPGKTYYVITNHIVEAEYLYSQVFTPCFINCGYYYDAFGFSLLPAPPSGQSDHWISSSGPETPLAQSDARMEQTVAPIYIGACGDAAKDNLVGEYMNPYYNAPNTILCDELTQSTDTPHFSLNSGTYSWAVITGGLSGGVECVWDNRGSWTLQLNSGYRNPAHNLSVGGAAGSPHIYGKAVDFHFTSTDHRNAISDAGKNSCGACREPFDSEPRVHLDWGRSFCPPGW